MILFKNKDSKLHHIYRNLGLIIGFFLVLVIVRIKNIRINLPAKR